MIFDNRLIFPPVNNPQRILECGYGNCDWAISVAESYPDCEVCVDNIRRQRDHCPRYHVQTASPRTMSVVITYRFAMSLRRGYVFVVASLVCPLEADLIELTMEQVLGVDISPHLKPEETPENLYLQVSHSSLQVKKYARNPRNINLGKLKDILDATMPKW